ncbi:MAG: hypothetical protein ACI9YE_003652 [Psychroserpens sp.]|jgi:hypothetical protein
MKEINDILKELDDAILIHPNELTDGTVSELPHYHFVSSKVKTLKSPLWYQAVQNVSAKLFDLDTSDINANSDDLYHQLIDFDFDDLNVLSKYYLAIDLDSYNYEETNLGHFLSKSNEIINVNTICNLLSISISDNLKAVTNFIFVQLNSVQKEEWLTLYEIEEDEEQSEYLLSALKHLI